MKFGIKKNNPHPSEESPAPYDGSIKRIPYYLIGLCIILGSVPFFVWSYDVYYKGKVFDGITIGTTSLSGMTIEDAEKSIDHVFDDIKKRGITISVGQKTILLFPEQPSLDPDIPNESLITIDAHATAQKAYEYGKHTNWFIEHTQKYALTFHHTSITPVVSLRKDLLKEAIQKELGYLETPGEDAHVVYDTLSHSLSIKEEVSGKEFNYQDAFDTIQKTLERVSSPSVELSFIQISPTVTKRSLEELIPNAYDILSLLPIELTDGDQVWQLDAETIAPWLTVKNDALDLDEKIVRSFLSQEITAKIFIEAKTPKFEIQEDKLVLSQIPNNGKELNIDKTIDSLRTEFLQNKEKKINLVIDVKKSDLASVEHQPSIKEIVAEVETDFKGSPKNRRTNIAVGTKKINGVLIEDGQEFSLISYLGEIDEKGGFLPELVIKGNETKPEYGGGLCQVSTTLFRAVTFAGLPILERHNHSYRVHYYEPPVGFDATIYSPKPDFRFKNDTGNPLLIQARIQGTKLNIELWGTKDGRSVEVDTPKVFNIKKAPEQEIIETTALKPGEKKCTEKAHNGADAIFERRTTYVGGEKKTDVFKSHYVVWPAVCYVGKTVIEQTSTEQPAEPQVPSTTSSPEHIPELPLVPIPQTMNPLP